MLKFIKNGKNNNLKFVNLMIFIFLMGVFISPFSGSCSKPSFLEAKGDNPLEKSEAVKEAINVQNALREIYREVNPAVVRIETEQTVQNHPLLNDPFFRHFFGNRGQQGQGNSQKQQGLGSGFIIDAEGHIVTNHHVVAPNNKKVDKIKVKLVNGRTYDAKLIGSDQMSDLALLKIDAKNLKVSHIGDSDKIEVGDISIAIGNPFGLSATFTMGVISSKGQDIQTEDGVARIQTDAAINPGNSGGPLLNIKGEVIGINQMIYTKSGGSVGIGFAIPINYAMSILDKLRTGKKIEAGFIGVSVKTSVTEEELKELKLTGRKGIFISEVELGSPAWKAGVRPYDYITHIDGKEAGKFSDLKSTVVRKGPGSKIELKVLREGKERSFTIEIGKAPERREQPQGEFQE